MEKPFLKEFENLHSHQISCDTLKKYIRDMLERSTQCKAILESINHDTGEYRIVLQGIVEPEPTEV